jgi:hypothetical protein
MARRTHELRICDRLKLRRRPDTYKMKLLDVSAFVARELDAVHAPVADAAFFVGALGS